MHLNNQELKICKLDPNSSKAKRVYNIFMSNPNMVFDIRGMTNIYNQIYSDNTGTPTISTIITRLYAKNKLIRTPTQLNSGHFYSFMNQKKIDEVYRNYLLPYDFDDNERILGLITQNKFERLNSTSKLDLNEIKEFDFIKKYGLNHFYNSNVLNFLATNVGFLMCDGHIRKNLQEVQYFFNQKKDAELFRTNFNSIFQHEQLSLKYRAYCFRVGTCNKGFAQLFNYLGVPFGNKVYQSFLIPNWIYNGAEEVKSSFLSIVYGSEGSKPQDNKWRIGFVISKQKEYVNNLLTFSNQIRAMLSHFNITTSHIQLRKQKRRHFCVRFYIKGKDNLLKFYNKIGFAYASEKQEVLKALLKRDNLIN